MGQDPWPSTEAGYRTKLTRYVPEILALIDESEATDQHAVHVNVAQFRCGHLFGLVSVMAAAIELCYEYGVPLVFDSKEG